MNTGLWLVTIIQEGAGGEGQLLEIWAAQGHLDYRMSVCNKISEVMIIHSDGLLDGGGGGCGRQKI